MQGNPPQGKRFRPLMREILRTNDPVLLSAVETLLDAAGIGVLIADQHMSTLEGAIGAFPRRLLVPDDEEKAARALLIEAGFGHELRGDG